MEISLPYTCVPTIFMIWSTVVEISMWRTEIGNHGSFFALLPSPPPKTSKYQNFEKMSKIAGDIIILHECTKNHNHMKYSFWDMEWDRQNVLSFWAIFFSLTTRKIKIFKKWKSIWRCHHFTNVYQKSKSYGVCFLRYGIQQTIFCHFRPFFVLLSHYWPQKIKIWNKCKRTWRHCPITHVYHKQRSYNVWFLRNKAQQFFVILGHFLPFDPPNNLKNQSFEKMKKKNTWTYYFILAYQKLWSHDVWFLRLVGGVKFFRA